MNFNHPLVRQWIPSKIYIEQHKYEKRKKHCKKCKIESDICFGVYYYLNSYALENKYHYDCNETENCQYFQCESKDLLSKAKEIGLPLLVELCTYHTVWLHYFVHYINMNEYSNLMKDWDSMYQSQHVNAKNQIHFLIYLILCCDPVRKALMQEIRDFTLCPPMRENGISGFEYKETKDDWEKKISSFIKST